MPVNSLQSLGSNGPGLTSDAYRLPERLPDSDSEDDDLVAYQIIKLYTHHLMMILETMIHAWTADTQVVMQTSKCIIKLAILQLGRLTNSLPWTLKSLQKGHMNRTSDAAPLWCLSRNDASVFDRGLAQSRAESTSPLIMHQSVHEKFSPDSLYDGIMQFWGLKETFQCTHMAWILPCTYCSTYGKIISVSELICFSLLK